MSKKIKLENLHQDDKNFNQHSDEGMALLKKSINTVGVIESITVSADDKIISGNARQEVMTAELHGAEPIVVETDGTRPIILKRTDINSHTKEFHEAALLANTVAKKNINLDMEMIEAVAVDEYGIALEEMGVEVLDGYGDAPAEDEEEDFDFDGYDADVDGAVDDMESELKKSVILVYDITTYEEEVAPLLQKYKSKYGDVADFLRDRLKQFFAMEKEMENG